MARESRFDQKGILKLNTMRTYVFVAMLLVVAIPFGFMVNTRQKAAFARELVKVEQAHLVIAENLASTLQRYSSDVVSTFDFLTTNYSKEMDAGSLDILLRSLGIRYIAAFDGRTGTEDVIYARDFARPSTETIEQLRSSAMTGKTQVSGVKQVAGEPVMYLSRESSSGRLLLGVLDTAYLIAVQKQVAFGELGHAMIVDQEGRVIAHPSPEWTKSSKDASKLSVVQRMMQGQTGVMQFFSPPLKADMIAGYTSVPLTKWGVMVPQPVSELWDAANVASVELMKTLLLLFVGAGAVGWILSGVIARPLNKIAETVVKVRDGDLSARVPQLGKFTPQEINSMRNLLNGLMDIWSKNREMLESALEAANNANAKKSQAISVLSHEMRTPLNGILGAIELIDGTELTTSQRRYQGILQISANTLLEHVNRVLEVSRLDNSAMAINRSSIDVRELLENIVSENTSQAEKSGNIVTLSIPDEIPLIIETDHHKLRNIIANLVSNAVKFTKNGQINIRVALLVNDQFEITVSDTGPGIAPSQADFVFEPFSILNSGFDREQDGTGLGLCIVKMSAEALGGHVRLVSDVGQGSEFCVSVPVAVPDTKHQAKIKAPLPNSVTDKTEPDQPTKKRILVVDDNEINRIVLCAMVERFGHEVVTAFDGQDALEVAMVDRFDIILMDISMPEIDGLEVARLLREHEGPNQKTIIVAQTAHASPDDCDRIRAAGMQEVLTKPISNDALREVLGTKLSLTAAGPDNLAKAQGYQTIDLEQFQLLASAKGTSDALTRIEKLLQETAQVLDGLVDGRLFEGDYPEKLRKVHNVAGACGMLGAKDLHGHLLGIEIRLKDRMTDGIDEYLALAKSSVDRTRYDAARILT
jgi:signal transduction histidine kinase/DNA-binding response OmpR family regulator